MIITKEIPNENLCSKLNKHVLIVINFFNYLHLDVVSIIVYCMILLLMLVLDLILKFHY